MTRPGDARHPTLDAAFAEAAETLAAFRADAEARRAVERFADLAIDALARGGRLLACGNGGSLADAMHFAEECVGRFRRHREALPALAFGDPATLTCIANDFGYDEVFARQVEAHGRPEDLLVTLSTSGESRNLQRAVEVARERNLRSVGLLGRGGGKLASEVDVAIVVPHARTADRVQEVHLQILHAVLEAIEAQRTPGETD